MAISQAQARTVVGPTKGWRVTTSGTPTAIDLSSYEGSAVRITALSEDVYYVFGDDSSASLGVATASTETDLVAGVIWGSSSVREVVPRGKTFLLVQQVSAAGDVMVHRQ